MKRLIAVSSLVIAAVSPALAGPPWITVEVRPTGGAMVFAHTYHHGTPQAMPLHGTAEGIVHGQRRSVPLRFEGTEGNVFAVTKNWGEAGVWVLSFGTSEDHGGAGVVVGVDRAGSAAFIRFPRTFEGASRMATAPEVEAMLRALDAGQQPAALSTNTVPFLVRMFGPPLLLALLAGLAIRAVARGIRARRTAPVAALI